MTIRPAFTFDVPAVAALIAQAFDPLPAARWLIPDDRTRPRILAAVFAIHVEHALRHGAIDLIDNPDNDSSDDGAGSGPVAAAVWFTDAHLVPAPPDYHRRLAAAAGDTVDRWQLLDDAMGAVHPPDGHDYLAHLAVHPAHQRRGLGRLLLDHHHTTTSSRAAYLEAAHADNIRLYKKAGYELLGDPITAEAGPEPTMWPMWRPASHPERSSLLDRVKAGPENGLGHLIL